VTASHAFVVVVVSLSTELHCGDPHGGPLKLWTGDVICSTGTRRAGQV
jgi:hypothetical protein